MPLIDYVLLSGITAIHAVLGDLCESFLKRAGGIKDSSRALGDHGGMFDRFDSLLLNGPLYVWFATELQVF